MNKQNILLILIFGIFSFQLNAQNCTPDPNANGVVYPNPANGFPDATVNLDYDFTMTISAPKDTTIIPGFPVNIDSVVLKSISGLPIGISYACEPANCKWNGGQRGCVSLKGTPQVIGNYPLVIEMDAYFLGAAAPLNITDYDINVVNNTSVVKLEKDKGIAIFPNPNSGEFNVFYKNTGSITSIQVFDILGNDVAFERIANQSNQERISIKNASPGLYFVSVHTQNGKEVKPITVIY